MGSDPYDFGARLRELRTAHGLSKSQLSKQAHVNRDTINRYETYLNVPNGDILKNLAKTLHTTTDHLLGMPDAPAIKYYDLSEEDENALQLFINLLERMLHANKLQPEIEEAEEA